MASVKVTISLPSSLAQFIDELAARQERPRSTVVAGLLEEKRQQLFEQELRQAYLETSEDSLRFAQEAASLGWEVVARHAPYDTGVEGR